MRIYLYSCILCRIHISFMREHRLRLDLWNISIKWLHLWHFLWNRWRSKFWGDFLKTVSPAPFLKLPIRSAVTWIRSKPRVKLLSHAEVSSSLTSRYLTCTCSALCSTSGSLSLQAQHKVKVNQHIIVGTLLCWKLASLPFVSAYLILTEAS